MISQTVAEAKAHLSDLIRQIEQGEYVVTKYRTKLSRPTGTIGVVQ